MITICNKEKSLKVFMSDNLWVHINYIQFVAKVKT